MKTNSKNIDNLLRDSLENYSSQPAANVRASISFRAKKFNFFKFNPGSFNVFYLSTLMLGISAIISFSLGLFENESTTIETKQNIEIKETTKDLNTTYNNEITEENIETTIATETPNTPINTRNYSTQTENNQFEQIETSNKIIEEPIIDIENAESLTETGIIETEIVANSDEKNDPISNESQNTTKTIIYDTVTNTNHVSIVDTVKTEVRETVKIKRPRRKNK